MLDLTDQRYILAIGDAPKVCARIATAAHELVPDAQGKYVTGNCVPIERTVSPSSEVTAKPPRHNNPPPRNQNPTTTTEPTTTTTTPEPTTTDPTTSDPAAPESDAP